MFDTLVSKSLRALSIISLLTVISPVAFAGPEDSTDNPMNIQDLPVEVQMQMMTFLDPASIRVVSQVSHWWSTIADDDAFIKSYFEAELSSVDSQNREIVETLLIQSFKQLDVSAMSKLVTFRSTRLPNGSEVLPKEFFSPRIFSLFVHALKKNPNRSYAKINLANLYIHGLGVETNFPKAKELLIDLAQQKEPEAMALLFLIGGMNEDGMPEVDSHDPTDTSTFDVIFGNMSP